MFGEKSLRRKFYLPSKERFSFKKYNHKGKDTDWNTNTLLDNWPKNMSWGLTKEEIKVLKHEKNVPLH